MQLLPDWLQRNYLKTIEPVVDWMVRRRVSPNLLTTIGTFFSVLGGVIYATGHIRTGGIVIGVTALFDVLDGAVARRTGRSTVFGAFYDSTLDRVADGAVLGGLAVFYATHAVHGNDAMVGVCILGIIGTFLISYTRARAEGLGVDAKVGLMQRPERVVLLTAPQAFFGLALGGTVLIGIIVLLTVTAWITAAQRIAAVYKATTPQAEPNRAQGESKNASPPFPASAARPVLKGDRP
jgi:CDP-diacylglycerol---glycerol-3-phosphate 3-phosphatidyltransferase